MPSLGQSVDLSIVYVEFQAKQSPSLPTHGGDRNGLLDSFCSYQSKLNKKSDSDKEHWDMALYLTGLDIYHDDGRKSYITMGPYSLRKIDSQKKRWASRFCSCNQLQCH